MRHRLIVENVNVNGNLGTKVTVLVTERDVRIPPIPSSDGIRSHTYEIHSEIGVRMFVMGIAVRKAGFSSRLVIDPIGGPVEEILEHDDGARTVIRCLVGVSPE